jgi:hypothetical protein
MKHSSGGTWYGDRFDDIAWSREGYDPGNTIGILEKDLSCALQTFCDAGLEPGDLEHALAEALRELEPIDL